jgi:uncharacterized cupredoxin-like copper-binding protein
MKNLIRPAALALAAVIASSAAALAATSVNVALLDMTAMGQGPGAGYGMMGQGGFGMMGRGGFGQGMMGGGQGGFQGGMMGQGMMSIRTDAATVKAGEVTFDVTNWSRSLVHEMLVVSVDNADAPLPYDYDKQRVVEDQIKSLGETDEMEPNATKSLTLDLAAGTYLLICNVPGHYGAGMQTVLTVTP